MPQPLSLCAVQYYFVKILHKFLIFLPVYLSILLCHIISKTGEVIVENSSFEINKKGFQSFLDQLNPYNKQDKPNCF